MIELKTEWEITSFDGRVIERFRSGGASESYHIAFVESAEIETDKKGRKYLRFWMRGHVSPGSFASHELMPEEVQQAQALVDEIEKVRASL